MFGRKKEEKLEMPDLIDYTKSKNYATFDFNNDDFTIIEILEYMEKRGYECISAYGRSYDDSFLLFKNCEFPERLEK